MLFSISLFVSSFLHFSGFVCLLVVVVVVFMGGGQKGAYRPAMSYYTIILLQKYYHGTEHCMVRNGCVRDTNTSTGYVFISLAHHAILQAQVHFL